MVAQVLLVPPLGLTMEVHEDPDTLGVDFRVEVTRSDLGVRQTRERPGIHLSSVLPKLLNDGGPAILFNGNNLGWWGNQFVIRDRELVYKRQGPLFDDGVPALHVEGQYAFFVPTGSGFEIRRFKLSTTPSRTRSGEIELNADEPLPEFGLSGFPLVHDGEAVWQSSASHAWDPRLLFDVPIRRRAGRWQIRKEIQVQREAGAPLVRHAMTVLGVDLWGGVVVLVVEKSDETSKRSAGMTVAEAADLLIRRFLVTDAIVLGAAGDAQLATTDEGFLIAPLVEKHVQTVAKKLPEELLGRNLEALQPCARPVPCYVVLRPPAGRAAPLYWFPPVNPDAP